MFLAPLPLLLFALPAPQVEKLNDPLVISLESTVWQVELGPVTERVLYLSDPDNYPSVPESYTGVYVVRVDGSANPLRLAMSGYIFEASFSPAGSRVVFRSGDGPGAAGTLRSVPTNGSSPPVQLHPGGVRSFAVTPDSSWVVYSSDLNGYLREQIFRAPIAGGPVLPLSPLPVDGTTIPRLAASPDGLHVVYQTSLGIKDFLFSVRVDGSAAPVRLDQPRRVNGAIRNFRVSPDGSRVVYGGPQDVAPRDDLYSVPSDGSLPPVRLNAALVGGGDVSSYDFSPDGSRLLYLADQFTDQVVELFAVPTDGSAPAVHLNAPLAPNASVRAAAFDPTGAHVLYRAAQQVADRVDLHAASAMGTSAPVTLSTSLGPAEDVVDWLVSTDGTAVLYRSVEPSGPAYTVRLWRVPIDGSQPPMLLFTRASGSSPVSPLLVTPDFARVLVGLDQEGFWSVATDGSGNAVRLDDPLLSPRGSVPLLLASFGTRAVFLGKHEAENPFLSPRLLCSVPVDGSAAAQRLSDLGNTVTGDVTTALVTPDAKTVAYVADQERDGVFELFRVPVDRSQTPLRLNPLLGDDEDVDPQELHFTADSSRILFLAAGMLHSAPLDGSQPAVRLSRGGRAPVSTVGVAPDGRVLYLQPVDEFDPASGNDLHVVPASGGADPIRLNPLLGANRSVIAYLLAPDGTFVVYWADQDLNDRFELYRVSLDGGAVVRLLDASTWSAGDGIQNPQLTPGGHAVVYRFRHPDSDHSSLYSVPAAGGAAPTLLTGSLDLAGPGNLFWAPCGLGRVVFDYAGDLFTVPVQGGTAPARLHPDAGSRFVTMPGLSPDGTRVLYLADHAVAGTQELYSVPVDGSAAPVRLSGPLVSGGDVISWTISPDGQRVVFVADALVDERQDFFEVPSSGGVAPLFLGSAASLRTITADSQRLLYPVSKPSDSALFSVPLNACAPARRLTPVPDGTYTAFSIVASLPEAHRVLFLSDFEQSGVNELFTAIDEAGALSVSPAEGPASGGQTVTVHGVGFTSTTAVWFDGRPATNVVLIDGQTLTATVPALPAPLLTGPGRARVVLPRTVGVRVGDCGSVTTLPAAYTYR